MVVKLTLFRNLVLEKDPTLNFNIVIRGKRKAH